MDDYLVTTEAQIKSSSNRLEFLYPDGTLRHSNNNRIMIRRYGESMYKRFFPNIDSFPDGKTIGYLDRFDMNHGIVYVTVKKVNFSNIPEVERLGPSFLFNKEWCNYQNW